MKRFVVRTLFRGWAMRDKFSFGCWIGVIALCVIAASGHPPASAQDRNLPTDPTVGTLALAQSYDSRDIADLRVDLAAERLVISALDARMAAQAERQASLDTKMSGFLYVISLLASGGIVLQLRKRNTT
jgi:hypothetical protein